MIAMRQTLMPLLVGAALVLSGVGLHAQGSKDASKGPPNALQGFSQNRDEPVHIEAATLEVRDKDKVATFSGDVRVKQGDTGMRCSTLRVFYEGGANGDGDAEKNDDGKNDSGKNDGGKNSSSMTADTPGPGGQQKIKRLEARGNVVVTQKEQTATGNLGIFDMRTNTVTLSGDVTMTQGKNILRGDKLVVNLTSGVSRVESSKSGNGRVQGLFVPSGGDPLEGGKSGGKPDSKSGGAHPKPKTSSPSSPPISLQPFR